jgi:LmbE family N-acetylglucosaminyl deacetylase
MRKTFLRIAGVIVMILLLFPFVLILIGRSQLHDSDIPQKESLIESTSKLRIMAFFPHPDDEVTITGTLINLIEQGHEVHLICMTKGEAGNSGVAYTKQELAILRTLEMQRSAEIIGVEKLHLMDYPDGGLDEMGLDSIKEIALDWIDQIQPDVLLSYDSKVGLYGHSDHKLSGIAVEEVFLENSRKPDFSPVQLFQVTLSPKQIQVALKLSSGFQKNYPKDLSQGLPNPDFSVSTQFYFHRVLEVMKAHQTQQAVLKDLMPYHDRVPAWIYSRIFDREYFHEVK